MQPKHVYGAHGAYFMLTKAYGRVPLITHTMSSDSLNSLHQSSVREIYDFVEQELSECLTLLPKSYPAGNDGRINYYTALAILAKVYLYDRKYSESALCCDKIIASGQYDLMPTYRDVFLTENNNSRESLFEAQSPRSVRPAAMHPTSTTPTTRVRVITSPRICRAGDSRCRPTA